MVKDVHKTQSVVMINPASIPRYIAHQSPTGCILNSLNEILSPIPRRVSGLKQRRLGEVRFRDANLPRRIPRQQENPGKSIQVPLSTRV